MSPHVKWICVWNATSESIEYKYPGLLQGCIIWKNKNVMKKIFLSPKSFLFFFHITCVSTTLEDFGPNVWVIATVIESVLTLSLVSGFCCQDEALMSVVRLNAWNSRKNFEFVKRRVNNWSTCTGRVVLMNCRPSCDEVHDGISITRKKIIIGST